MSLPILAQNVHYQLFNNQTRVKVYDRSYPVVSHEGGRVKSVEIGFYKFLTQNPLKNSSFGLMARQGHKITWVLRGNNYIGRVHNGIFTSV